VTTCPDQIIHYMHDYLDHDISEDHKEILLHHLETCAICKQHFDELQKSVSYVQSLSKVTAPDHFTKNVMSQLPKEKRRIGMKRWISAHPFLTAASLFIILMAGTLFSSWNDPNEFSFTKNPNLVVKNHTVIVPKGKVVKEDVTVRNGNIRVEGTVQGNVTVIKGKEYMASAGNVTGKVKEIDKIFEWIWYKMKDLGHDAFAHNK